MVGFKSLLKAILYLSLKLSNFFRPCFFSEAKKAKERFKVVVVGGGSDRWASRTSVYPYILKGYVAFVSRLVPG